MTGGEQPARTQSIRRRIRTAAMRPVLTAGYFGRPGLMAAAKQIPVPAHRRLAAGRSDTGETAACPLDDP